MKTLRTVLVASIAADVAYLVKRGDARAFKALDSAFEATGFLSNYSPITCKALGDALVALAGVIDERWLKMLAHTVKFCREQCDGYTWDFANAAADKLLREAKRSAAERAA